VLSRSGGIAKYRTIHNSRNHPKVPMIRRRWDILGPAFSRRPAFSRH
jgi:hypothetical protein